MKTSRALRAQPRRAGSLPVLAMPYAGGGDGCFARLARELAPAADLLTVRLPGRSGRWGETGPADLRTLAADLVGELGGGFDAPFALFGHSMGALLAFEFAHEFRRRRGREPACLIVSGLPAPDRLDTVPRLSDLPGDELRSVVRAIGQTERDILDDAELWSIVSPVLRQDFGYVDRYEFADREPLSCPIAAYAGEEDVEVPAAGVAAWRRHTAGAFHSRIFPGGHFFFEAAPGEFATELTARLGRIPHRPLNTEETQWH